jgi:hypothetical protein
VIVDFLVVLGGNLVLQTFDPVTSQVSPSPSLTGLFRPRRVRRSITSSQ